MAKTIVRPWKLSRTLVQIESTEVLTEEEREEISKGIRIAFSRCFAGESWPTLLEVQQAIDINYQSAVADKLVSMKYC